MSMWHGRGSIAMDEFVSHHDDVIKWKHFPRYWPFVRGIHRSPANSPHKGQWRRALMFSLICVWMNCWVNSREAGDLRRHRAHYNVTNVTNVTLGVGGPAMPTANVLVPNTHQTISHFILVQPWSQYRLADQKFRIMAIQLGSREFCSKLKSQIPNRFEILHRAQHSQCRALYKLSKRLHDWNSVNSNTLEQPPT